MLKVLISISFKSIHRGYANLNKVKSKTAEYLFNVKNLHEMTKKKNH